ncbi:hypothetical protein D9M68_726440 [compost metagenome]
MVHEEPRLVPRDHRAMARPRDQFAQGGHHLRRGAHGRDHFGHLHERHRVEEVQSRHPLRMGARSRDLGHDERRGVAREDRLWRHDRFEAAEQRALGFQVFHDGFDQDVAIRQVLHRRRGMDPTADALEFIGIDAALRDTATDHADDEFHRLACGTFEAVEAMHPVPGLGEELNNAATHGPGADDGDLEFVCHGHLPVNSGRRLSRKARMPSVLSGVSKSSRNSRFSSARAASGGKSGPWRGRSASTRCT